MGGLWFGHPHRTQPEAFDRDWLDELRGRILGSPLLAGSTLNERFAGTQGFSVTFQLEGLPRVWRNFPEFRPFLDQVMGKRCNAFFLNPLVIYHGARVAPHIDCSLKSWTAPVRPPLPGKVSVLYVDVPEDLRGGELWLHRRRVVARVRPERNLLVEFLGSLRHEVTAVETELTSPRISLVCESYRLPDDLLACIPEFFVRTKRPFEAFLDEAMGTEATS